MLINWRRNIADNHNLVKQNAGPELVTIVTGSQADRNYWWEYLEKTKGYSFRRDRQTTIVSVHEQVRKGNFLGTLNAWKETLAQVNGEGRQPQGVSLMSMVFGQGKRLSPFTQSLGNRKPAFPIPLCPNGLDTFMCAVDLSNIYANSWLDQLNRSGFRGLVVKWGDEAIIPGKIWSEEKYDYQAIDAIRFVWKTELTPELAREKEWIVFDEQTSLMQRQLTRQEIGHLKKRIAQLGTDACSFGVNLGSLAVTYPFLDTALEVLGEDVADPQKWVDWDPYVWIALTCQAEADWESERAYELEIGKTGIQELETHYPDFFPKIQRLRQTYEQRMGRPMAIAVLDFGEAFWADIGLQTTLRKNLESLVQQTELGEITRELYQIPRERDENNNIIVGSTIPVGAEIRNSILINSVIQGESSVIQDGIIYGSCLRDVQMPAGGAAIQCVAHGIKFAGPHGIAFRSIGRDITIPEGGRHTTLVANGLAEPMISNEEVDYKGEGYAQPVLGNRISFEEAARLMDNDDYRDAQRLWREAWDKLCGSE